MIEHVVMMKMHEEHLSERDNLKSALQALETKIEDVDRIETGVNFAKRSDAFDLILKVWVKDQKALENYAVHPDHQSVLKQIKKYVVKTAVVDFYKTDDA
ncbi:MAG: Dabb family protein [Bacteroidota bacterium]